MTQASLANMTLGQHLPKHRAIVAQWRTLGRTLAKVLNPWSLFPWPFVAAEKLGQVSLGQMTPWPSVYLPMKLLVVITNV